MSELVKMRSILKSYDGKRNVLDGLDFSLNSGEIALVYGDSGCGKSTFLNIVGLLDSMTYGEYLFDGKPIDKKRINTCHRVRAEEIGFVFQAYCLIEALPVRDNILMPFLYNAIPIDHNLMERMEALSCELHISELLSKKAALLSGGEKQRVAIARAMLKRPRLLIADEPTGNLDERNSEIVAQSLAAITKAGTALLVVTHNHRLVFHNADSYVLKGGRLQKC